MNWCNFDGFGMNSVSDDEFSECVKSLFPGNSLKLKYYIFSIFRTLKCSTADQMIKSNSRLCKYFGKDITDDSRRISGRFGRTDSRTITGDFGRFIIDGLIIKVLQLRT